MKLWLETNNWRAVLKTIESASKSRHCQNKISHLIIYCITSLVHSSVVNGAPQLASTGANGELLQLCSGQIAMSFVVTFDWGKWHKLSMSSRLHFGHCTHVSPSQGRRFFQEENKSLEVSWISPFLSDISLIRSAIQGWVMIHSDANTHRKRLKESRHWKGDVSLFLALRIKVTFRSRKSPHRCKE